jgi:ketosteroid isomerase-like protein
LADEIQMSPEQLEVWSGEEAYWQFVNSGDGEGYLALWHEDFVGWPCDSESTKNFGDLKDAIANWSENVDEKAQTTTITPEGVVVDSDFAITYVAATTVWLDEAGREKSQMMKLVHTWKPTDDGWKIIGGMCGPLDRP